MWKQTAATALALLALCVQTGRTRGADAPFSAGTTDGRIVLSTQGHAYTLILKRGVPQIQIGAVTYPVTFQCAEWAATPDWFTVSRPTDARVTTDTAEEKTVTAVFPLSFAATEPPPGSTRDRTPDAKLSARLEMTLTVKHDLPCLFLTTRVVNTGAPITAYSLMLLGTGSRYAIPGAQGIERRQFRNQYADIGADIAWVHLDREDHGLGVLLRNRLLLREAGSAASRNAHLFLNTSPKAAGLQTGEAAEIRLALLPAAAPEPVAALHQRLQ